MCRIIISSLVLSIIFVFGSVTFGQNATEKTVLTIGRATDDVIKHQKRFGPLITYLASRLKDVGIDDGRVVPVIGKNISDLIHYLKHGSIDVTMESVFPAYQCKKEANASPLLLAWKNGEAEYRSLIFVRKDSKIHQLGDLKGKIIAFEDPRSTSSYFIPKKVLEAKGFELVEVDSFDSYVPEGKIGYVFGGSEINISSWVFFKKVAAGTLSSSDWKDPKKLPENFKEELKIVYESRDFPRFIVMVRAGLNKKLVERIKEELIKMDKNEEGAKVLKKTKHIQKFEEFSVKPEEVFKPIEDMLRVTEKEGY